MRKLSLSLLCGGFVVAVACLSTQTAEAIAPFKSGFEDVYIVEEGATPEQEKLAEAYGDKVIGKCYLCHANMRELGFDKAYGKLVRNSYGKALSEYLDKENFSSDRRKAEPDKVKAEIEEALKKVAAQKVNPDDADSPTYGELLAKGKLPSDGKPDAADVEAATKKLKEEGKLD